jgi:hypothetical protein
MSHSNSGIRWSEKELRQIMAPQLVSRSASEIGEISNRLEWSQGQPSCPRISTSETPGKAGLKSPHRGRPSLGDRRVETSPALSYPARPDDARPLVD